MRSRKVSCRCSVTGVRAELPGGDVGPVAVFVGPEAPAMDASLTPVSKKFRRPAAASAPKAAAAFLHPQAAGASAETVVPGACDLT